MTRKVKLQLDVFDHSPEKMANYYRIWADTERHNPYQTPEEREKRYLANMAIADQFDAVFKERKNDTIQN